MRGKAWSVRRMCGQIHAVFDQEAKSGSRSVSASIVVVEQHAMGSIMWAALAPLLEDLGQAVVDYQLELTNFQSLRGMMVKWPDFAKKDATFCNTLLSLNVYR